MKSFSKFKCKDGFVMVKSKGTHSKVTYCRPKNANDLKRNGRELSISVGNATMRLNGTHIRSLKKVLAAAGEI